MTRTTSLGRPFTWAGVPLAILLTLAPAAWVTMRAPPGLAAAAVFPPWWSPQRTLNAAAFAGQVTSRGRLPGVVIVTGGPDLHDQLRRHGAWFTLDPSAALLCGSTEVTSL